MDHHRSRPILDLHSSARGILIDDAKWRMPITDVIPSRQLTAEERAASLAELRRLVSLPLPPVPEESLRALHDAACSDTGGSQAARSFLFWLAGQADPTGYRGSAALSCDVWIIHYEWRLSMFSIGGLVRPRAISRCIKFSTILNTDLALAPRIFPEEPRVVSRLCEIAAATMLMLARLGLLDFTQTAYSTAPLVRRMPHPAPGGARTAFAPPRDRTTDSWTSGCGTAQRHTRNRGMSIVGQVTGRQ